MATEKNFQATDPAAPAGARNVTWQVDGTAAGTDATTGQSYFNTSAYMTDMVGDSGSGGADGLVPAPPAGSAAAGKFLKADGTFAVPVFTSPLTTKGDLFGHSTVDARIPVGVDGQVLTADSTQALGVKWAGATTSFSIVEVSLAPSSPGNFTVAHGLGVTPTSALIQMTSGGQVWFQTVRFDSTNLYLVASDSGITGKAVVFYSATSALAASEVALAPSSPGNFTVAHGLGVTPTSAAVQMKSGGQIWFQSPTRFDSTNLYLVASDAGVTGNAVLFH